MSTNVIDVIEIDGDVIEGTGLLLLTVGEVAEFYGIVTQTVYRAIEEDRLPAKRLNGRLWIDPRDLPGSGKGWADLSVRTRRR